jgi:hypothetical protein
MFLMETVHHITHLDMVCLLSRRGRCTATIVMAVTVRSTGKVRPELTKTMNNWAGHRRLNRKNVTESQNQSKTTSNAAALAPDALPGDHLVLSIPLPKAASPSPATVANICTKLAPLQYLYVLVYRELDSLAAKNNLTKIVVCIVASK